MLWFNRTAKPLLLAAVLAIAGTAVSGCTVQPLNAVKPAGSVTPAEMSGVEILPVSSRVGQQVRNQLIFGLNGGGSPIVPTHLLSLTVSANTANLSVETTTLAPTSAQVTVRAQYTLTGKDGKTTIATGLRQAIASFDRTNQSFANLRAERDAENRAAKEVAEQIKLVIAATLATQ